MGEIVKDVPPNHTPNAPSSDPILRIRDDLSNPKHKKPPDPRIHYGDRRDHTTEGHNTQDGKPPSESIVRSRERSNSPRHYGMVDRTATTQHKAKMDSQSGPSTLSVQMASMRSRDPDHRRIRSILTSLVTDPLPEYPAMDSINMLFWNCRGVGNNAFKRNMRELISIHKPAILILMETKVCYSFMANFFNNLGFIVATIADPTRRARGIWLLCDTTQVNIRASHATNQVI
ncbi:hypothetical protein LOK49_LG08G01820 [Camellia lanceoleosa]|uniref:Uncharacterized protein n=1 Tax=Camellia lanceoleosa TaxID=1840588 RepID=A0ACC0GWN9_9ERIC|nr:hypothetical protein LOK49_LG08G01820 [Camellia lanceoleosa]